MTRQRIRRRSAGFTLVEILVVIAIIGILTSLITAAAMMARNSALNAVMRTEINQLEMSLTDYKNQYGDYPPDFFGVDRTDAVGEQSRAEVVRHLRKAFPSYRPGEEYRRKTNNIAPGNLFDKFIADLAAMEYLPSSVVGTAGADYPELGKYLNPGTALPFWLGGMPGGPDSSTKLIGFAANPSNPFDNNSSASRKPQPMEFDEARLFPVREAVGNDRPFYYYVPVRPTSDAAPYVYFKPRRNSESGKIEYAVGGSTLMPLYFQVNTVVEHPAGGDENVAVPYLENAWEATNRDNFVNSPSDAKGAVRQWHKPKSVQVLCAGFDGTFGHEAAAPSSPFPPDLDFRPAFRFTPTEDRDELVVGIFGDTAKDHDNPDYDNLTNFLPGTIEDQMP